MTTNTATETAADPVEPLDLSVLERALGAEVDGEVRFDAGSALGWLPVWARVSRLAPRLVNAALRAPGISRLGSGGHRGRRSGRAAVRRGVLRAVVADP